MTCVQENDIVLSERFYITKGGEIEGIREVSYEKVTLKTEEVVDSVSGEDLLPGS